MNKMAFMTDSFTKSARGSQMRRIGAITLAAAACASAAGASTPGNGGPYNASFLRGGIGIDRVLERGDAMIRAGAPYSMATWVRIDTVDNDDPVLIALGDPASRTMRALMLVGGKAAVRDGGVQIVAARRLAPGRWTHLAAVSDGAAVRLFVNGREAASGRAAAAAVTPRITIAPPITGQAHFGGSLVDARVDDRALSATMVRAIADAPPSFDLVQMWRVGIGWEWQNRANTGLWRQQDPSTLPQTKGGYTKPVAKPVERRPALEPVAARRWRVNGWRLAAAPDVSAGGAALSRPDYDAAKWHAATVPGTVLTTLVDRGVYPDPYYGLNNMRIPESIARQDYWYRTSFTAPAGTAGQRLTLMFGGINYASEVWVNGARLGGTAGAFIRGRFDILPRAGENVIAVRVLPPPHPGIPHEQSIAGGVGNNGGQMAIDGPTFVAAEGWDWIPGIRDRNTGIWRPVELIATGSVRIGDPQIITDLPLPRTDSANIHIVVPIDNAGPATPVTVRAAFDGVSVTRTVNARTGASTVRFAPSEFAQLRVAKPRLWWPNGYGDPALHDMRIEVDANGAASDARTVRFGIREVSYDLSLFDTAGDLRRVNVQTTDGKLAGGKLIDVRHEAIKETPNGWVQSLTAGAERSPAVTAAPPMTLPHVAIRVNGVAIAARGGNWGMDDAMKRVSRERLAPYFRLQREANMNIIRNWMGNNNEEEFFDLADENGMMIMNDFWQSTQNFQVEPQDPQLFLANARDTVARYRNHPSIIMWFGRNEGVPHPILNEGLDDVVFAEDGTRWYTGSSNTVNLQGSGPYNYRPPAGYFTDLASGFSVETGTLSLSTAESIESYVPKADLWPLSDTLAYHDWHFDGNGDTKTFMAAQETMFGAPTDFADFERKSQMMNLETHKAMFEGFLGHLWTKNSGRLLWMTHPAWPSNAWQIYSSDYDTHAAYYGVKRASQPIHVQLNLPGNELVVLNTTQADAKGLIAKTRVTSLDNRELFSREDRLDALANRATPLAAVPLDGLYAQSRVVLVNLSLVDAAGKTVAENFYWRGRDPASYRALNDLAQAPLTLDAAAPVVEGGDRVVRVMLANRGSTPAINAKLTLVDGAGKRILPAYYSDNYVALLPGQTKAIEVRYPASVVAAPSLTLRGWNVVAQTKPVR